MDKNGKNDSCNKYKNRWDNKKNMLKREKNMYLSVSKLIVLFQKTGVLIRERLWIVICMTCRSGVPWFWCLMDTRRTFVDHLGIFKVNRVIWRPSVFNIICCRVTLVTQLDTFINALMNTSNRLSVNHLFEVHCVKFFLMGANFVFSRSSMGNLTASFTKCYTLKNWGLALTLRVTPSVLNRLCLAFSIFYVTFILDDLLFFFHL